MDILNTAARTFFGVPYLFPYQRLVISNLLEAATSAGFFQGASGRSEFNEKDESEETDEDRKTWGKQIVILPTGAGKSLCFQLPAMLFEGATLVIYPILSLMADQERRLRERGFEPAVLRGGQSPEERTLLWEKIRSGKSRFIIANPEVLLTQLETLKTLPIVHAVIDEAHCVGEWGESFRPSYLEIAKILDASRAPLVTAFTATASAPTLEKIETYIFGGERVHRIIGNPDRSNIKYRTRGCILRDLAVRDLLLKRTGPAIVFCSSRIGTEKLAKYLRNELKDKNIKFYHAGLERDEKTAVEQWFFRRSDGVLVATCAYGMGVDKADIRMVIHRDCPPSVEAYLQESGRAGRDGLPSEAVLLYGPDDANRQNHAKTESDRTRLAKLLDYANTSRACRRTALLKLLDYDAGSAIPSVDPKSCCDVCDGTAKSELREEASLLAFFKKNPRRYTVLEGAQILAQIEAFRWSQDDAKTAVLQLIRNGKLRRIKNILWKDKLVIQK
ncbi:MAG: RecQ family ATP-dependent DNA helicase [Spirochaetaceae bacterium]|jgi:ATP-dependent DNA helicase RecQ|nr:RecQ family ATP-dependent DNA helicase [Spirochaetaceae bacterium]